MKRSLSSKGSQILQHDWLCQYKQSPSTMFSAWHVVLEVSTFLRWSDTISNANCHNRLQPREALITFHCILWWNNNWLAMGCHSKSLNEFMKIDKLHHHVPLISNPFALNNYACGSSLLFRMHTTTLVTRLESMPTFILFLKASFDCSNVTLLTRCIHDQTTSVGFILL